MSHLERISFAKIEKRSKSVNDGIIGFFTGKINYHAS